MNPLEQRPGRVPSRPRQRHDGAIDSTIHADLEPVEADEIELPAKRPREDLIDRRRGQPTCRGGPQMDDHTAYRRHNELVVPTATTAPTFFATRFKSKWCSVLKGARVRCVLRQWICGGLSLSPAIRPAVHQNDSPMPRSTAMGTPRIVPGSPSEATMV